MGKQRVTQLLEQLKQNQEAELQNAAAIFTVAQVAVNELDSLETVVESPIPPALLPSATAPLDQAELKRRYGNFQGCRQAAKQQGIRFSKTPTWAQLVAAFNAVETFRSLLKTYVNQHPNPHLQGITFELKL